MLVPRNQLFPAVAAGITGGVVVDAFLIATKLAGGTSLAQALDMYRWIASVALGSAILDDPAAPALGVLLHFGISILWALGYVYLTRSQPRLLTRPFLSGAGFGLVVYCFMQIILIPAGQYHRPTPPELAIGLVANIVFFGVTVALVVSRMLRRSGAPA